jgi:hypothetical protein
MIMIATLPTMDKVINQHEEILTKKIIGFLISLRRSLEAIKLTFKQSKC